MYSTAMLNLSEELTVQGYAQMPLTVWYTLWHNTTEPDYVALDYLPQTNVCTGMLYILPVSDMTAHITS